MGAGGLLSYSLELPCGGWHRFVPLHWVLWVPALPKHPARAAQKDAIAVSGVGGGMFCIPLPRRSLQRQSSNKYQEKHLMLGTGSEMMDGASAVEPRL